MSAERSVTRVADCDDVISNGNEVPSSLLPAFATLASPLFTGRVGVNVASPRAALDITGSVNLLHLSQTDVDTGGYMSSAGSGALYCTGGAQYNSFSGDYVFTAKYSHANGFIFESGNCTFWADNSLTAGNTFTPSYSYQIDRNHVLKGYSKSSTNTNRIVSLITSQFNAGNSTDASFTGSIQISVSDYTTGERPGVHIVSDGTQALIGFFGATPVAKPTVTGLKGGNTALASLITALVSLGLIADGTS